MLKRFKAKGHWMEFGRAGGACDVGTPRPVPDVVRLLARALSVYVRRQHHEGHHVPPEIEELTAFLVHVARTRPEAPAPADESAVDHHAPVPERLLVTKGEAAERLGVSVRTIERLVATGRLRQVHVERLARIRVTDLEAYVDGLDKQGESDTGPRDCDGQQ